MCHIIRFYYIVSPFKGSFLSFRYTLYYIQIIIIPIFFVIIILLYFLLLYYRRNVDLLNPHRKYHNNFSNIYFIICLLSYCFVPSFSLFSKKLLLSSSCISIVRCIVSIWSFFFFEDSTHTNLLTASPFLVPRKCFYSSVIPVSCTFVILKISIPIHHLPQWQDG